MVAPMKQRLAASVAFALLGGAAAPAAADSGFLEGVIGVGIPLAEDDYQDSTDAGLKLGFRAGSAGRTGVELSGDYTDLGGFEPPFTEVSVRRFRGLLGARHLIPAGKGGKASLFVRAGVGVDVVQVDAVAELLGTTTEWDQTDAGIAAELGLGVKLDLGNAYVGAHVAVPMAFHFDDDDPDDNQDADLEYTAVDLDLLFTAGVNL